MFSCARLLRATLDFCSTPKIADVYSTILQRTGLEFDHVAIDIGYIASISAHLTRDFAGHERDVETVKIIHKQLTNMILRRIQPRKSLAFIFDGSEPLWKVQQTRQSTGKRIEEKVYRRAGSPMMYLLENHLCGVASELRRPPMEFLVSGSGVPGPAEGKLSAWMLDLATRILHPAKRPASAASVDVNDSFCLLGNPDLFLVALGCTAFHNITTLSLLQGEFKSLSLQDGLGWMRATPARASPPTDSSTALALEPHHWRRLAATRTDLLLLYLLAYGMPGMGLAGLGVGFGDLKAAYDAEQAQSPLSQEVEAKGGVEGTANGPVSDAGLFFDESPRVTGGAGEAAGLRLRPTTLSRVLARVVPAQEGGGKGEGPVSSAAAAAFVELLLQSHAALGAGGVPNLGWAPHGEDDRLLAETASSKMNLEALIDYLCRRGGDQSGSESQGGDAAYISPTRDRGFALTGIESLLLSAPRADLVESIIPLYTGGDAMPAEIVKDIVGTRDLYDALSKTRSALREMGLVSESASGGPNDSVACNDDTTSERTTQQIQRPMNNHPAIRHYPTHYFVRTVNSRGPPPGWSYYSVNLGLKSEAMNIRYTLNRADPDTLRREFDSLEVQGRTKSNTLHLFDEASEKWTEVPCGRLEESPVMTNGEPSSLPSDEEEPPMERTTLRVLTWNVQFNRHSGERTPLGRTGIDWCTTTRYLALSEVLSKTDADIIAMQEVEPSWCSFLCQQPWVRTGYVLSSQERSHAISPWGVMMLLRKDLNIKAFEHGNVPAFSGHISVMPEATLTLSKHTPPVMVSSMHLLAPYNQNNVNNREVQLENMLKHLKELANQTTDSSSAPSHVLMGDFNDTPARFFRIPKELGYRDAWEELHPHWMSAEASSSTSSVATAGEADGAKRGYTIDGDANPYAGRIIEKEFYGRPDRVLYSSKHLQPTCAELVGTQSVLEVLKEKGITRQVDHPQDDIPSYLFPSDHFGMLVEFQVL